MENIARIQIVEPQPERRTAVAAAYRRGYADALEDMRQRQREKKRRRQYFIMQKLNGVEHTAFIVPIEDKIGRLCGWYPLRAERCEVVEVKGQVYLRYLC